MSANTTYRFLGYTLRPARATDLDLARTWTAADEVHRETIAPGFWLEQDAGIDCYVLCDETGPVFFFRMQRAIRLLIQFDPAEEDADRTRNALQYGLQWLTMALGTVGMTEIIFDSAATLLRRFVTGRLGFRPQRDTLTKPVSLFFARTQTPFEADTPTSYSEEMPPDPPNTV